MPHKPETDARRSWCGRALGHTAAIFSALLILAISGPGQAEDAAPAMAGCTAAGRAAPLPLTIENVRSGRGSVTVSVYGDRPEDFLVKGKKLMKVRLPARLGTVTGCLTLPKTGIYALAVYHDEDGNGKLTSNFVGIPMEGYGFSNDPTVLLAPPTFDEVAFNVQTAGDSARLRLHYP